MVSMDTIADQLKKIGFNYHGWGRTEIHELQHILLEGEEIYECVNGIYDGGFALMVATDIRVLLIDKKPLNYLTVEDMRYELISEIDYNHRLIGAYISLASGNKILKFTSINQPRLRKLITHVQTCMAESKKQETSHQEYQNQHLEQINHQLQSYLVAQYKQQQKLHDQIKDAMQNRENGTPLIEPPAPIRPDPKLSDYMYAQQLLEQYKKQTGQPIEGELVAPTTTTASSEVSANANMGDMSTEIPSSDSAAIAAAASADLNAASEQDQIKEMYQEGQEEVFGKSSSANTADSSSSTSGRHLTDLLPTAQFKKISNQALSGASAVQAHLPFGGEVNPLRIAYSKLPMLLRYRKLGIKPKPPVLTPNSAAAKAT
ncbi:MAG TPA: PH domain-containing protein [Candidatus Saccharimonadales bacterium]|nr:PH domain-containing protein [Candidatus Saccharimonadales bacterium]